MNKHTFEIGDLVNFHTESWVFKHSHKSYASPGIIISRGAGHGTKRGINQFQVYWKDAKVTWEHDSYLLRVN
jgi:hypothetical protein